MKKTPVSPSRLFDPSILQILNITSVIAPRPLGAALLRRVVSTTAWPHLDEQLADERITLNDLAEFTLLVNELELRDLQETLMPHEWKQIETAYYEATELLADARVADMERSQ